MGHLRALDGLRGVAIAAVVAFHSHVLPGGFVGVDLFFSLSGFLITTLLFREFRTHGDIRLPLFWARRALRLVPALVVTVLLAIPASLYLGEEIRVSWVVASLVYVSNAWIAYGDTYPIGLVSHTWSLAMEEQFYLVWPVVLGLVLPRGIRAVGALALALCVISLALRLGYEMGHGEDPLLWKRLYFAPEMRIDALASGCFAAAWLELAPTTSRRGMHAIRLATGIGALVLIGIAATTPLRELARSSLLFTLTAASATAVVVGAVRIPLFARALSVPPLVALGKISYGLYLVHVVLFPLLMDQPLVMRWFAAVVIAAASHLWLEKPFLALKPRFERKGAEPRTPAYEP